MLTDYKISDADITANKVQSVSGTTLTGTVPENKKVFDNLPMLAIDKLNTFIQALYDLGYDNTVFHSTADVKYLRTNSGQLEISADGKAWQGMSFAARYVWFMYSAQADGTGFHAEPQSTDAYLGIALTDSGSAPTDKANYKWAMFKSEDFQSQIDALKGDYDKELIELSTGLYTTSIVPTNATGVIYYDTDSVLGVITSSSAISAKTTLGTLPTAPTKVVNGYDADGNAITIDTGGIISITPKTTIASGTALRFYVEVTA